MADNFKLEIDADGIALITWDMPGRSMNVIDLAAIEELSKIVEKIALPEAPAGEKVTEGLQGAPAHGLIVTPDGKTLGVLSKMNSRIYFYSLPDLKLQGEAKVGHHPDWVTGTPDGKRFYVANAGSNSVSVIDVATRKELMQIPVGQVPKRNITAVLP